MKLSHPISAAHSGFVPKWAGKVRLEPVGTELANSTSVSVAESEQMGRKLGLHDRAAGSPALLLQQCRDNHSWLCSWGWEGWEQSPCRHRSWQKQYTNTDPSCCLTQSLFMSWDTGARGAEAEDLEQSRTEEGPTQLEALPTEASKIPESSAPVIASIVGRTGASNPGIHT